MFSNDQFNPTGRFTGLADCYARNRPSYPLAAINCLIKETFLAPGATVVDVGCGTGIATRLLAVRGLHVIGIEPNADMLKSAASTASPVGAGPVDYMLAKAEKTGLQSGVAKVVTAFQAFHWFDQRAALAEFQRLLEPNGFLGIVWNDRDESDPVTVEYDATLRVTSEAAAMVRPWRKASDILFDNPWFERPRTFTFASEQFLDEEGLIGRAQSASYAPKEPAQVEKMIDALRALFTRRQQNGLVCMRYAVSLFLTRRADAE